MASKLVVIRLTLRGVALLFNPKDDLHVLTFQKEFANQPFLKLGLSKYTLGMR